MINIPKTTLKVIIAACFGSMTYGYTSGIGGNVIAQPSFVEYFDYQSSSGIADTFNGLLSAGGIIGVIIGAILSERYGRRISIWVGTAIGAIGSALMAGSVAIAMLYVSRVILGISIGMLVMLVPLYQTEISSTEGRGLLVCMHGVFILIGYSVAAWINFGFFFVSNKNNWRVPVAIQALWPLLLAATLFILPESPRWLIAHNKIENARIVMKDLEPEMTDNDFDLLHHQLLMENQNSSWKSIITTKSYRKRLYIGLLIMIGGQASGTLVVTNYGPTIYATLGFSNKDQLLINAGYITSGVLSNFVSALLSDYFGRKTLFIFGMVGSGILAMTLETIMIALYGGSNNKAGNSAAVAFIFMHIFFYGGCVDANTYVYVNEIWPTHIRSKGAALSTLGLFIGILAFTTGVTTAIENIKWRFFLVFIVLSFAFVIIAFFFFPETKNLSLEEIGEIFGDYVKDNVEESKFSHKKSNEEKINFNVTVESI
ncbi:hypothetical protein C6P40_002132 [Pichia californica]|uniref:Major facilitator superfamily (MFS) profile domain-containing protein n=1 Tax=Pichia californica TaxID=460514 RepID=A0A9P7BIA3_9ASCO|nr:hypothetical protein C6P42_001387 [[Candida] californica]KAG0690633.1 hypothetical protein C6P40_002132 [[Candida] californica]